MKHFSFVALSQSRHHHKQTHNVGRVWERGEESSWMLRALIIYSAHILCFFMFTYIYAEHKVYAHTFIFCRVITPLSHMYTPCDHITRKKACLQPLFFFWIFPSFGFSFGRFSCVHTYMYNRHILKSNMNVVWHFHR